MVARATSHSRILWGPCGQAQAVNLCLTYLTGFLTSITLVAVSMAFIEIRAQLWPKRALFENPEHKSA